MKATMAPGRYATRMTISQAVTRPVTGMRSCIHPREFHTDRPTQATVKASAKVNLAATDT
jgi:hypothetical protein